jgi:hypothetical protein
MPQSSEKSYIHNLGNLTMLPPGVNSSLKDLPPAEKAAKYVECGMQSTLVIGRDIQKGLDWNGKAVRDRAIKIEDFVRNEWGD